jgi:autotransporter translocation and assembly factor TamB
MMSKFKILGLSLLTMLFLQTTLATTPGFGWIKGSGNVIKETRNVSSFTGIDVGGAFDVILIKANKEKVVLEIDDNLMPYVTTKVFGGILEIDNKKDFRNPKELKVTIYYKSIDEIDLSGAASLFSEDVLKTESLEIDASGASDIELKLDLDYLEADFSGASRIEFSGRAKSVEVETSGATVFRAFDLETESFEIDASGAAVARIWVTKELSLEASGASSVRYKGSPSIDIINISGASSVRKY